MLSGSDRDLGSVPNKFGKLLHESLCLEIENQSKKVIDSGAVVAHVCSRSFLVIAAYFDER